MKSNPHHLTELEQQMFGHDKQDDRGAELENEQGTEASEQEDADAAAEKQVWYQHTTTAVIAASITNF